MSATAKKRVADAGERNRLIKLIHVAKRDLKMAEDSYRQMLWSIGNVKSSADLDFTGLQRAVDHLKACGFKPKPGRGPAPSDDESPQMKMVRALWIELADAGVVRDRSEKALTSYIRRQAKVDNPRWLHGKAASLVIEALKAWAKREGVEVF